MKFLFLIFLSSSCFASSPEDILSMPEQNRFQVAEKRTDLYNDFVQIAFDKKQSTDMRWKALTVAAAIKKEKSHNEMLKALKSDEWFMRNAALVAIRTYSTELAHQAGLQSLSDKALVVRSAALKNLKGQLSTKERERLWKEYQAGYNFRNGQSLWVRSEILQILSKYPEEQSRLELAQVKP